MEISELGCVLGRPRLYKWIFVIAFLFAINSFMSCTKKMANNEDVKAIELIADSVYVQQGNRIVASTFDTLRSSLLSAISSQGIEGAIDFCNEEAYPLTATYADSIVIRRTASRFRNPNNKPDSLDLSVLAEMEKLMDVGKTPTAKIVRQGTSGEVHFFKPILLQSMCLNCHGTPGLQIHSTTFNRIKQLYPNDRAVNFKEGDLRGTWHIIFKPQKK
jgi:hypothetical protein